MRRIHLLFVTALIISACGSSEPRNPSPGPSVPPSAGEIPITGSERLGWDQHLSEGDELERLHFAAYVDDALTRTDLPSASCAQTSSPAVVSCLSALPPLIPGRHTLTLVTYDVESGLESGRSSVLTVVLSAPQGARTDYRLPWQQQSSNSRILGVFARRLDKASLPTGDCQLAITGSGGGTIVS